MQAIVFMFKVKKKNGVGTVFFLHQHPETGPLLHARSVIPLGAPASSHAPDTSR